MSKVIPINVINDVKTLYFGGALLSALFLKDVISYKKIFQKNVILCSCALSTIRVGRSVTRLTVHWAFSYWSGS